MIRTTGIWEFRIDADQAILFRPATDDSMTIDDVDPTIAQALFDQLDRGCGPARVLELLSRVDEEPEHTLEFLAEHGVIRRATPAPRAHVAGDDALATALRRSIEEHGWRLGDALQTFEARQWQQVVQQDLAPSVVATAIGGTLVAARGCAGCLVLRTLGRLLEPGGHAASLLADRVEIAGTLIAELLLSLERSALREGEGLWVSAGKVARGWVLPHLDCVVAHEFVDRSAATMHAKLSVTTPRPATPEARRWAVEALLESPFAPAELHQISEDEEGAPLPVPFLWGDTRLVRRRGECVSVSIDGIIHGAGRSADECHTISMSEAVERLGAQSTAPDGRFPDSLGLYCRGYDLIRERGCRVPFERVVVGLAAEHSGDLKHRERTFTGAASHVTMADAVVHATQEIVKRDAFMISWYRKRRLRRVEPFEPWDDETRTQLAYLRKLGFVLEHFDLTLDLPLPHVLLRLTATRTLKNFPAGGALLVPSGGFTPREAVHHTLKLACLRVFSLCHPRAEELNPSDPELVERTARRVPFWTLMARYLDPRASAAHAFLGSGGSLALSQLPTWSDEPAVARLPRLREWFRERDVPWMVVRLTDAVAASLGFEVVKVVMPSMTPLALSRDEVLRCPRLHIDVQDADLNALNPDPHPLY